MTESGLRHRLAAILAADAAGYSRLMATDERGTVAALDSARAVLRKHIESNQGRVIDMAGDSVLAVFESAAGAVNASLAIQSGLEAALSTQPQDRRLRFRIGVHLGDVIEKADGTVYGDGVNIAARLQALAEPGGVWVSDAVRGAVKSRIAASFEDRGEQQMKNIAEPVRAYRLRAASEHIPQTIPTVTATNSLLSDRPSIAVLAFDNMSGDPAQEHFCDGISEDVITDLSKISGLAVIGRQSAFTYKGRATDLRTVGRELGVRYLLEGSVRKIGDRVRVTAQLIEAETGTHVWANRYDHNLSDAFLVGDAVVQDIVEALDIKLARGEDSRIWRRALKTPEAREAFLRGWSAYYESTPEGVRRARDLFHDVVRLEPDSSLGYAYVALTHAIEVMQGWSADPLRSLGEAGRLAEKAIALDPHSAGGHGTKGLVSLFEGRFDEAIAAAQQSLDARPMCASPRAGLAYVQLYTGEYHKAIQNARSAISLNPVYPGWYRYLMAAADYFAGRHGEALATADSVLANSQKHMFARAVKIAALVELGRTNDAKREAASLLRDQPDFSVDRYLATQPFRDAGQRTRHGKTLREAGLP